MPRKTVKIFLPSFFALSITMAYLPAWSAGTVVGTQPPLTTDCAKNPAATQKKMTHILRSLGCSQVKNLNDCEMVAGLMPQAIGAAIKGASKMSQTAKKYRPENIAACEFVWLFNPEDSFAKLSIAWMLFGSTTGNAAGLPGKLSCQAAHADGLLRSTSGAAAKDAKEMTAKQQGEVAKQSQNVKNLEAAREKYDNAVAALNNAEKQSFALDDQLKDASDKLEQVKEEIASRTKEMESMAKDSFKYQSYQKEVDRLTKERSNLKMLVEQGKSRIRNQIPDNLLKTLNEASKAKAAAYAELSALEKNLGGNLQYQKDLLDVQQANLKQYKEAGTQYEKAMRAGATTKEGVQASLDAVKSVGAVNEAHAKSLANIQYLLDAAERSEVMAVQRAGISAASRLATAKAAAALGARAVGRAGVKILSGVATAAGSSVAMAADLATTAGNSNVGDEACLMSGVGREKLLKLTSFSAENHCKAEPSIKDPGEFRSILASSGADQMAYFNNAEFCTWLNDVYKVHAPKIKATCTTDGASYTTDTGKHIQVSWNPDGSIKRVNSYGDGNETDDAMYSVFMKNNQVDSIGMVLSYKQSSMERSFKSPAFDDKAQKQFKLPVSEQQVGAKYKQKTDSLNTSFHLQALSIAEIKSCCQPGDPAVEDSTCSSRYGIQSAVGGSGSSRSDGSSSGATK
jgi:hypothetical protein